MSTEDIPIDAVEKSRRGIPERPSLEELSPLVLRRTVQAGHILHRVTTLDELRGVVQREVCAMLGAKECVVELVANPTEGGSFSDVQSSGTQLCVPLIGGEGTDRYLGRIVATAKVEGSLFNQEDETALTELAWFASIAIEHLHEQEQRKQEQGALQRAEGSAANFSAIFNSSHVAIVGWSLTANVTIWNPAAEELYGYTADEMIGQPVLILTPPEQQEEMQSVLQRVNAGERPKPFSTVRLRKDGKRVDVLLGVSPIINARGRVIGAAGISHDITDARLLEERYLQAQKMEAIGHLAGGVAHDFNNLLTVINGYGELLLGSLRKDDPAYGLIQQMYRAGERAALLTRQLLAFSRRQVLEPRVLDLNVVVSELEKMLHRLIGEDIILSTSLETKLGPVKVDPGQMQQVLMNLCVNSRDAMPLGGRLTIETRNVSFDDAYTQSHPSVQPGQYVMLAVSDTGMGMDQATRTKLFEPFFTTKEPGKGTGLGLATVYGIIKQSGGHIEVYSEPDHGATFKVYLPQIRQRPTSGKSSSSPELLPRGTETILLVEDEEAVRALEQHVLRNCGYRVLTARHGKEALQIAMEHEEIQMLISDVVMPHIGGRVLSERMLEHLPRLKVLLLSGYTDDAVIRHGILEASVAFLQKPFTTAGLAQKVREVLDSEVLSDASGPAW